ncbi:MAG: ABC transporter permease [Phycisphaerae bacterium]|nr:ABC transporter permease [Saprospiraceae bacterium]
MLSSYLTLAFRNLRRNGSYLLINVLGLGIALAFCILSYTQVRFAYSFDQWHPAAERIFRVETFKTSNHLLHGTCPASLTEVAAREIPGLEAATRIDSRGVVVKLGENVFNQQVHFVDENFLDLFQFPLLQGQARLSDRDALLISEDMAHKFFGGESPVGKTLTLYADLEAQRKTMTVSGVFKNTPKNSSLQFQFLTHLENQLEGDKPIRYDSWKWFVDAGFLKLSNPADAPAVEAALQQYIAPQNAANQNWQAERYRLEALPAMAMNARDVRWNNLSNGIPPSAVWGNITVALMLLLTACLNFANTTISIGNRRLREMGVRKVMGGTQRQLMFQLLSEAGLVCVTALALGMIVVKPMTEWYNATWKHIDLHVSYLDNPPLLYFLAGVTLFTTLLAGAYPAFYISGFNPSKIFRGAFKFGGASFFSRLMMGAQVAISLAAVVVGFSFARNAQVQREADLGYAGDGILGVETQDLALLNTFNAAIRQNPKVLETARTRHHAGFNFRQTEFSWQGQKQESLWFEVGKDYMPLMGMTLVAGEGFSAVNEAVGSEMEVLVNEMFVREIGGNAPVIGQMLKFDTVSYRIAGVVKDFMTDSPFDPKSPVVVHCAPESKFTYCIVKTKPEDLAAVHADMETTWKALFPYKPFTGFYQSEVMAEALEVSDNIAMTMLIFAFVILLLTVSGLFSIVSLNALKQFKSLALRRVLGAKSGEIAFQLNRNYLMVIFGAILVGCWGGRFMALAMMNSIYKIHAGVQGQSLTMGVLTVLLAMLATVGVKLRQILRANLGDALKAE